MGNRQHAKGKENPDNYREAKGAYAREFSYEWKRIEYFFEWFDPAGATEEFWKILKLALTADNEKADERERSNMIFFYEHATELFENLFKIWKGGK